MCPEAVSANGSYLLILWHLSGTENEEAEFCTLLFIFPKNRILFDFFIKFGYHKDKESF